ncbi:MAG: hypothetical protein ACJ8C4_06560 [Gemmataceae bacterium]
MAKRRGPDRPESESHPPSRPQLPAVTHLQFLVLDYLARAAEGLGAKELSDRLAEYSDDYRGPKFYQLMGRLADAKLVEAGQRDFNVAGTIVTRTLYKIAPAGMAAWRVTAEFYRVRIALSRELGKDTRRHDRKGDL